MFPQPAELSHATAYTPEKRICIRDETAGTTSMYLLSALLCCHTSHLYFVLRKYSTRTVDTTWEHGVGCVWARDGHYHVYIPIFNAVPTYLARLSLCLSFVGPWVECLWLRTTASLVSCVALPPSIEHKKPQPESILLVHTLPHLRLLAVGQLRHPWIAGRALRTL